MAEITLYNKDLRVRGVGTGSIRVIDASIEDFLEIGFLDSETLASAKLSRLVATINDQLGLTWKSATFWDPLDRTLGGAAFMSNIWREVE